MRQTQGRQTLIKLRLGHAALETGDILAGRIVPVMYTYGGTSVGNGTSGTSGSSGKARTRDSLFSLPYTYHILG